MYSLIANNQEMHKEATMLQVSEKANEVIKDFLKDKEVDACIRIFLSQGG